MIVVAPESVAQRPLRRSDVCPRGGEPGSHSESRAHFVESRQSRHTLGSMKALYIAGLIIVVLQARLTGAGQRPSPPPPDSNTVTIVRGRPVDRFRLDSIAVITLVRQDMERQTLKLGGIGRPIVKGDTAYVKAGILMHDVFLSAHYTLLRTPMGWRILQFRKGVA